VEQEADGFRDRQGEAYRKERSVIRKMNDVDGRARVARDEDRVLDVWRLNTDEMMQQIWTSAGC